ncbi:MAG: MBL fold metallo-hydrolase [Clostridiales bacterium]|nr:MBL fold metallo-hydrolase [Clostridiales bacterium]
MKVITCATGIFGVNTYLISEKDSNECIIIDPGGFEKVQQAITENELIPKHILLTHGHFDHIGGLKQIRDTYHIDVYAHTYSSTAIQDPRLNASANTMISRKEIICDVAENIIEDDQSITLCALEIKAIYAPGHSMGSMVYVIDDCVFTGDVLFRLSIGRTDFYGGDYVQMKQSLDKLKSMLTPDMKIYPGHGESSVFSYELDYNPYLR